MDIRYWASILGKGIPFFSEHFHHKNDGGLGYE
jgi:hypothetical protein